MTARSDLSGERRGPSRRGFVAVGAGAMSVAQTAGARARQAGQGGPFWPNGARLAVALSMVVETGADPAPTTNGPDNKKFPDLYAATAGQYASKEGIPRMLDMFDRRKVSVTSMICGQSCETYPDIAKQIAQRGHEMGAHGHAHVVQFAMDRDTETAFIKQALDTIEKTTGQRPVGYNCRGQLRSPNTISIAQQLGCTYHIDDISRDEPFVIPVNGKPFAVVPYTSHLNDIGYFNSHGLSKPFAEELKYEFDALYAEAESKRRLMIVTIHDAVSRASHVRAIDEFIAHAQRHHGVWFARGDQLAKWALESKDSIKETVVI